MPKPIILRFVGDTKSLRAAFAAAGAEAAAFGEQVQRSLGGSLAALGQRAKDVGRRMTIGLTLPTAAAGVAATRLAVDFESSMSKIIGLVGVSQRQVDEWSEQVLALSRRLPQSPQELADALFFVTSAGFRGADAMKILKQSARAAAGGLGETKVVADAVTSAVNAYGIKNLSAAAAVDVLTATVREGKVEPEELAAAVNSVIAPAQALGIKFSDVGGALAALSRISGDASDSATQLTGIFRALIKPSAEAKNVLASVGLSMDDVRASIKEKGLMRTLLMLRERIGDNAEAYGDLFGRMQGVQAFLSLTGENAEANAVIFEKLDDAVGSTDRAFAKAAKTGKFKLQSTLSSIQVTAIKFGRIIIPIVNDVAGAFASFFDKVGKISPLGQKIIVVALAVGAALGPLIWVVGNLAIAFSALLSPIGLVIAAIAAVVVAGYLLYRNWDRIWKFISEHKGIAAVAASLAFPIMPIVALIFAVVALAKNWRKVWAAIQRVTDAFVKWVKPKIEAFKTWWAEVGPKVKEAMGHVRVVLETAGRFIVAVVERVVSLVSAAWDLFGDEILSATRAAWLFIQNTIGNAIRAIAQIIELVLNIINGDWGEAWSNIMNIVSIVWDQIKNIVDYGIAVVRAAISAGLDAISAIWSGVWSAISWVVGLVWGGITDAVSAGWSAVKGVFDAFTFTLSGSWSTFWGGLSGVVSGIHDGVVGAFTSVIDGVKRVWNTFVDFWNSIEIRVPKISIPFAPDVGGFTVGLPDLKKMELSTKSALGRIVSGPMVSLLGEEGPEVVLPIRRPARADALMDRAGLKRTRQDERASVQIHQEIHALDPREAARISGDEIAWIMKTNGY